MELNQALMAAVAASDAPRVSAMLKFGADVNYVNDAHDTPLMVASAVGDTNVISILIAHGANVNAASYETALAQAAFVGNIGAVKVLLNNGADVNRVGTDGQTPLEWAFSWNHLEVFSYLLGHGAVFEANKDRRPLLIRAIEFEQPDMALALIAKNADINIQSAEGTTPLMAAVHCFNLPMAKLLLEKGAKVDMRDSSGRTAFIIGMDYSSDYPDSFSFFRPGAPSRPDALSRPYPYGRNAYYGARMRLAELLMAYGADINARDNLGCSVLAAAYRVRGQESELTQFLKSKGATMNADSSWWGPPDNRGDIVPFWAMKDKE